MFKLEESLAAWGTASFDEVLRLELAQNAGMLPLQQGLALSSSVADAPIEAVVLGKTVHENTIRVKVGIFYQGLVGGCSCVDDPTPDSWNTEYCLLLLEIDRVNAMTKVSLLPE